ncbi:hypothetical protein B0H16DRAFT_1689138 [Mycena metata]|uniref:Uncharacterized protein n=1 Tax=Mycena metata TaxID=1033252 RepID=A0AAD7J8P2_9AGAR|nr:hypothetical protein B0H16DRAFT_1689138 [Mycena metata]
MSLNTQDFTQLLGTFSGSPSPVHPFASMVLYTPMSIGAGGICNTFEDFAAVQQFEDASALIVNNFEGSYKRGISLVMVMPANQRGGMQNTRITAGWDTEVCLLRHIMCRSGSNENTGLVLTFICIGVITNGFIENSPPRKRGDEMIGAADPGDNGNGRSEDKKRGGRRETLKPAHRVRAAWEQSRLHAQTRNEESAKASALSAEQCRLHVLEQRLRPRQQVKRSTKDGGTKKCAKLSSRWAQRRDVFWRFLDINIVLRQHLSAINAGQQARAARVNKVWSRTGSNQSQTVKGMVDVEVQCSRSEFKVSYVLDSFARMKTQTRRLRLKGRLKDPQDPAPNTSLKPKSNQPHAMRQRDTARPVTTEVGRQETSWPKENAKASVLSVRGLGTFPASRGFGQGNTEERRNVERCRGGGRREEIEIYVFWGFLDEHDVDIVFRQHQSAQQGLTRSGPGLLSLPRRLCLPGSGESSQRTLNEPFAPCGSALREASVDKEGCVVAMSRDSTSIRSQSSDTVLVSRQGLYSRVRHHASTGDLEPGRHLMASPPRFVRVVCRAKQHKECWTVCSVEGTSWWKPRVA